MTKVWKSFKSPKPQEWETQKPKSIDKMRQNGIISLEINSNPRTTRSVSKSDHGTMFRGLCACQTAKNMLNAYKAKVAHPQTHSKQSLLLLRIASCQFFITAEILPTMHLYHFGRIWGFSLWFFKHPGAVRPDNVRKFFIFSGSADIVCPGCPLVERRGGLWRGKLRLFSAIFNGLTAS